MFTGRAIQLGFDNEVMDNEQETCDVLLTVASEETKEVTARWCLYVFFK